jgi:hypothetical protein
MARVLSYNHHEPGYINKRKEIILDKNKLEEFAGYYKAPKTGEIKIQSEEFILNQKVFSFRKTEISLLNL